MARLINGTRTLQEVAALLNPPVQVTLTMALKGIKEGWLTPAVASQAPSPLPTSVTFTALCDELGLVFGKEAQAMVERALHMARLSPVEVMPCNVPDVLLALEFQLQVDTRDALSATLHSLQLAYSA